MEDPDIHISIPVISVVMPTYNDGPYLREAIDSILNQTFTDFEFIIVNDGSTDLTDEIIRAYSDERIVCLVNELNLGNTASRNKGMQAARGKYIAIMDSDDISTPKRFAIQYEYLEKHPDIGILGGASIIFDENSWFIRHHPSEPEYIRSYLLFKNPISQPTVMFRRDLIAKFKLYYNSEFENGGDFDLWHRAVQAGVNIVNIRKVLLLYRVSDDQVSSEANLQRNTIIHETSFLLKLNKIGIFPNDDDLKILYRFIRSKGVVSKNDFDYISLFLKHLDTLNRQSNIFHNKSLKGLLFGYRMRLIRHSLFHGLSTFAKIQYLISAMTSAGPSAIYKFWKNEGSIFKKKINKGKPLIIEQ